MFGDNGKNMNELDHLKIIEESVNKCSKIKMEKVINSCMRKIRLRNESDIHD